MTAKRTPKIVYGSLLIIPRPNLGQLQTQVTEKEKQK